MTRTAYGIQMSREELEAFSREFVEQTQSLAGEMLLVEGIDAAHDTPAERSTTTLRSEAVLTECAFRFALGAGGIGAVATVIKAWLLHRKVRMKITDLEKGISLEIEGPLKEKDLGRVENFFRQSTEEQ